MKKNRDSENLNSEKIAELRRRAEEIAKKHPQNLSETEHLIHELEVHQIELEMQNEELRASQFELEKVLDRFSDLYDFAPVGYFTLSESGLIISSNLTFSAMLGIERGYLLRQPLSRFIFEEDQDIFYVHRKKLFETQESQSCRLRVVRKDESSFPTLFEGKLVKDKESGKQVCWATVSDIRTLVVAEKALEKLHAELEERVEDRTQNLQILVNAMSGREIRMAELKKVITKLRKQLKDNELEPIAFDPLLGPNEEW